MIESKLQGNSFQNKYETFESSLNQTKKILTHLAYLKQFPISKKHACFIDRMIHEQSEKYEAENYYLHQLKQHLNE